MSASRLGPLHPAWLLAPLGLLYCGVLLRLVCLSAWPSDGAAAAARSRASASVAEEAPRASILDCTGRPLAESVPSWRLVMDALPRYRRYTRPDRSFSAADRAREMGPVAASAGVELSLLLDQLAGDRVRSVIAERLSPEMVSRLQPLLAAYPDSGLRLETGWARSYPQGCNLSHAVGYVQHLRAKDPAPVVRGVAGLEAWFDESLRGTAGSRRSLRVAAAFGVNPALEYQPPDCGTELRTTLDAELAAVLRHELGALAEAHRPDWSAGLVLDPRNGQILALAAIPDFDPNDPGASVGEDGELAGGASPLGWPIEPGSTMKPLVVARALASGAIDHVQTFGQEGGRWFARGANQRPIRNARGVPDTPLDWRGVIVHSSNIGAGKIGLELGRERLHELLLDLRFDRRAEGVPFRQDTGLLGDERAWSERQMRWTVPSVAMGHQVSVTPLRLAAAHAALVNGGLLFDPHLIPGAAAAPARVYPEAVAREVRGAMVGMVELDSRTWLHDPDLSWGGKSGTVQDPLDESHYTSLFVGFAPAEAPRYLALVVAERPRGEEYYGSRVAGPAVMHLLRWALGRDGEAPPASLDRAESAAIVLARER